VQNKAGQSGTAAEKQEVLRDLKTGGVKVIGTKGDLKDVDGRTVSGRQTTKNGDVLKLWEGEREKENQCTHGTMSTAIEELY
jgi:hypothetical protein